MSGVMEDIPIFRASKKRRFARPQSTVADNEIVEHQPSEEDHAGKISDVSPQGSNVNVSDVIKLRKHNKSRGGVQFSNVRSKNKDTEAESMTLALAEPKEDSLQDITNRFTQSTGPVLDIDRHMMAYIDSEMAKRHTNTTRMQTTNPQTVDDYTSSSSSCSSSPKATNNTHHPSSSISTKLPYATQNPLSEFDLGPQAHDLNLARTTAAINRAQSNLPSPPPEPKHKARRPRKPRLGRDGKPLRPRPRKTRNSDDIARDALVEQVMHEHRLEGVYDSPAHPQTTTTNGVDADADEQLAEQFRQEFMDAMAERQQRNQNMAKGKAVKGSETQVGGPKLGGSRSARAKMQASMQTQGAGEKK